VLTLALTACADGGGEGGEDAGVSSSMDAAAADAGAPADDAGARVDDAGAPGGDAGARTCDMGCASLERCVDGSCAPYPPCAGDGSCEDGAVCRRRVCLPADRDFDGDGVAAGDDCDESDPAVSPDAPEDCNEIDDDCDEAVDEEIAPRMCSSACGGGSESCEGGAWTGCTAVAPTAETCDGVDEDCDSSIDESLTRPCSTACGAGDETCIRGAWLACTAPTVQTETCDGSDQDCDGTVDEGFRAEPVSTTFTALVTQHPACDGASERFGLSCNAAIHRFCRDRSCVSSGFGPVENTGDTAHVACVEADIRGTTYTALSAHQPSCDGATERHGLRCNEAIHRWCRAAGFESGFGPLENSGDTAFVACVSGSVASGQSTTYATLASHHPTCDGATERFGPSCLAASKRFCAAAGFASGFGPVSAVGGTVQVTCVRP